MKQLLVLFLFIPMILSGQVKDCGADITLSGTSCTPQSGCFWTGPNGYTSTDCAPTIFNACPNQAGLYSFTGDDCNGCPIEGTINVSICGSPSANIFDGFYTGSAQICQLIITNVTCCDAPIYAWENPSGIVVTNSAILAPSDVTECGQYCAFITACGSGNCPTCTWTACYDIQNNVSGTPDCCIDPCEDCTNLGSVVANNTPDCGTTIFSLNGCPSADAWGWSITPAIGVTLNNGAGAPTFSVTFNPTTSITYTVSGNYEDDCGNMLTDQFTFTLGPCVDCNCSASVVADDANCELDITVTGTGCSNYSIAILQWGATNCSSGTCTITPNGGLPAVTQSYDPLSSTSFCANDSPNDPNTGYTVILDANNSTPCNNSNSSCVNLNCCLEPNPVLDYTVLPCTDWFPTALVPFCDELYSLDTQCSCSIGDIRTFSVNNGANVISWSVNYLGGTLTPNILSSTGNTMTMNFQTGGTTALPAPCTFSAIDSVFEITVVTCQGTFTYKIVGAQC